MSINGWEEADLYISRMRPEHAATLKATHTRFFVKGYCRVMLSKEPRPGRILLANPPLSLHLSISCEDRYPTWDEIKDAKYSLTPNDLTMVMIFPKPEDYVNIHNFCFHLWEWDLHG